MLFLALFRSSFTSLLRALSHSPLTTTNDKEGRYGTANSRKDFSASLIKKIGAAEIFSFFVTVTVRAAVD
jgi:hypothetical protein